MRATFVPALIAGVILCASPALGDDNDLAPPAISPTIAARIHWIRFTMVSGRVAAASSQSVPKMLVQSPGRRTNRRESLGIEINGGSCSLEYLLVSPLDALRIEVMDGSTLSIRRTRSTNGYTLEFQQRPDRPLLLTLQEEDAKHQWQAHGLWHLYLQQPEIVREHLFPLLEQLHPSWQLAETAAAIEETLLRTQHVHARQRPEKQQWAQWVQKLGSATFSERESAERALRDAGQAVVPYLQSLSSDRLDAEQSARIRAIVQSLSVDYEDRVDRVASWLAGDETVWLALLGRDNADRRRIAAEQLNQLLGEPIDFDPDGSAEMRHEQLEQLHSRLSEAALATPIER